MKQRRLLVGVGAALLALAELAVAGPRAAEATNVGLFEGQSDVGAVRTKGTAAYDAAHDTYTLTGSGTNMWAERDELHLVWRKLKGDFQLTTRAAFGKTVGEPNAHRKLGVIVRASLEPDAAYADVALHGDGLTSLQYRRTAGATTEETKSTVTGADVLQIERHGDDFTMKVARFGDMFTTEKVTGIALGPEVYVGLFVCAHDAARVETGTFRNVRLVVPAGPELVPYRDYLGSFVEILTLDTGAREIVATAPDSIQAPNWTPDGKFLIYNTNGRLFRFDLAKRTVAGIDTGFATNNNNDHVLSFDGTMLGISNHSKDDNGVSIVYTLPSKGGTPSRVTKLGPSYLHGWSPDKKFLIYTAEREGDYDIWRSPVGGGSEVNLTKSKGLDDGSEYAPDGKHIYFNSVRSGSMQLWRMGADGSNPEQLTNDEMNNWFPHVSPDGKRIVFLSFGKEVRPDDHPFYQHVYLRMMPVAGGPAKVVAYLYGGQGTINVPSWSPDGKRVAFVSNSGAY